MKWFFALVCSSALTSGASWYVATNGAASNNGTISSPWDLATALTNPVSVTPGDTIWMRGGTYTGHWVSALQGNGSGAITLRQYAGERAVLDNPSTNNIPGNETLVITKPYANYWGFECMNSHTNRISRPNCVEVDGANCKLINLIVHDGGNGIVASLNATNCEISGCVSYFNGYQAADYPTDRGHGHSFYLQGFDGVKKCYNNIGFDNFCNGLQIYSQGQAALSGFVVFDNIMFNSGAIARGGSNYESQCYTIGGLTPMDTIRITNNYGWAHIYETKTEYDIGYISGQAFNTNRDLVLVSNYFAGGRFYVADWTNVIGQWNTFLLGNGAYLFNQATNSPCVFQWDNNTYYEQNANNFTFGNGSGVSWATWQSYGLDPNGHQITTSVSGTKIVILTNSYDPTLASVAVYNWDLLDNVPVDLSGIARTNSTMTIRGVQDYFGTPVFSGTYVGGVISLPMTNLNVAVPVGLTAPPATGPQFNTFVISYNSQTLPTATIGTALFY